MKTEAESNDVEVWLDGEWIHATVTQLDPNDIFRMRKPDGSLLKDNKGNTTWVCRKIPEIRCDPVELLDEGKEGI